MEKFYQEPSSITKADFLTTINENDEEAICFAIVNAVHFIDDYDWLVEQFSSLLEKKQNTIKEVAICCVGHLARLHENADKSQLINLITPYSNDIRLKGRVEDAISDINIFGKDK